MTIATILATSSLFFNIGVGEATHGGIHISGANVDAFGSWVCPNGSTGIGNVIIGVEQQNDGRFVGRVDAAPIIFVGDRITSAQTDGETFTITGFPLDSCGVGPYALEYTVTGECGEDVEVSVSVDHPPDGADNDARGTYPADIHCEGPVSTPSNTAPTAALTANPSTINEGETSVLDASGSSDPDVGDLLTYSFTILDNGLGTITGQTDASDPTATYEAPSDVSSDQTVTIQVEVNDGNGGTDTATAEIVVEDIPDTTPPVVTVPPDITREATSIDGAEITYEATAEDDVDGTVDVTCNPPSGSTFPIGQTTVECSATDAAGNIGTGSFTVTIQDTTPPAISVPDDITEEATGPDGAVVSFDVSAEDLVDGPVSVSCDHDSGDTFPLGETTVTCSAQDSRGNSASESFTITVQDTTAPDVQITGAVDRTGGQISDGGTTPIPYIRITFEAIDAVGIDSTECSLDGESTSCTSPKVYEELSRGSHEVTVRATDEAGNTGQDEFSWTVSNPAGAVEGGEEEEGEEQLAATTAEEEQSLSAEVEEEQQPSVDDDTEDDEQA